MTGYMADLPPARFNLARYCLDRQARAHGDRTALIVVNRIDETSEDVERWSFAAIDERVRRMAAGLAGAGFAPGERLFIRMGNSADYAFLFFAANAAGLVPIPASAMLSAEEVSRLIADSGASAIAWDGSLALPDLPADVRLIDPQGIAALARCAPVDYADTAADDPAFLIYTSGTLGAPKGVLHAQRAVWGRRPMYRGWEGFEDGDIMLHAGAFNWTYTLGVGLFDPWANGLTAIVYTGERDIAVWPRIVARFGATIMAAVPTLYRQMLKYCDLTPDTLAPLRHALTAGEALPATLLEQWHETTGRMLYEALGMSEISTYISSAPSVPVKPGAPGKPQPGRAVAVLPIEGGADPLPPGETGLIAVHRSDPGLMLGYWNRPDEDALVYRGDWFVGGDVAHFDEDGYLWFEGRNDDLMNAFGYRVSPLEVESVLDRHRDVAEVAVGEVSPRAGLSIVAAFVVARTDRFDPDDLMAFAAEHLAAYKAPRAVFAVKALPRNPNGKIRRKDLQRLVPSREDA